jgi:molybdopterin-dependent oxidoreductase alpha subunit
VQDEDAGLEVHPPKDVAAGLPGVLAGGRSALRQMGVRRSIAVLREVNQTGGFDCPGCAWPEGDHRSHAEFCENGAKAVAEEATRARIGADFFAAHTIEDLRGRSDHWLGQQGRLTVPVVKRPGGDRYEAVTWSEAIAIVTAGLQALGSPDQAAFYTSGRTSNEAAFLYQLLVRRFGTNNLPDCSNLCHESSGVALTETIGVGKGSVSLTDVEAADLVIVMGQNPGTNHPRMLTSLERVKRRGGRIMAVNPLPEAGLRRFKNPQRPGGVLGRGTELADLFLQVRVNGDLGLFQLLNHELVRRHDAGEPVLDAGFIDEHTDGFDAFADHIRALDRAAALAACGLGEADVEAASVMVLDARSIVVCWAMGITQHRNAVATIREVVNFALLRGNLGRPGAGLCPVRGHSNVQGDRTMGIYEKPSAAFLDALGAEFGFEPPRDHGFDTVDTIRAMRDGRVSAFVAMGGNFAAAAPDTAATYAALRSCDLTVQVSTKLNRSHVECGATAVILPCLGRTERDDAAGHPQFVSVEDSMSAVHRSEGKLDPAAPDLPSEVSIVCRLALALWPDGGGVDWSALEADHDAIRDRIAAVVPGFERYNERVREPGGFVLPHPPRDSRTFPTATGRARFTVNPLEVLDVPDGCLLLQTIRSHDQFNTTIYGLDDRYRGITAGRRVVFAHPDDLAVLGFADGDVVDVVSHAADGVQRRAERFRLVAYPVARGTGAAYFPETNVLVPLDSVADGSQTPTSKSIVVSFAPAQLEPGAAVR